jgi:hypothetical protein
VARLTIDGRTNKEKNFASGEHIHATKHHDSISALVHKKQREKPNDQQNVA